MRRLSIVLLVLLTVLLVLTAKTKSADSSAGFRIYGVAEDGSRHHRIPNSNGRGKLICEAGFNAVRHTVPWVQGQKTLNNIDKAATRNAVSAASGCNLTVILTVYPYHDRDKNPKMPTTSTEQRLFADFVEYLAREFPEVRHWEIGNEPNWSFFWWPQFKPDGSDAAIRAYSGLLALTYDKLKAINPENVIIGGALASVGEDDPNAQRRRHSPTRSIELLGKYYRESGRIRPIMDWVSIHPYPERPGEPPETPHPTSTTIGLADYDKLVRLLGEAFDGTAQPGSTLPILWSEYGVETVIPPDKASQYQGKETSKPVPEDTQAVHYIKALELTACQPTVVGILFFLAVDERDLGRWQSGIYYADERNGQQHDQPKNEPKKSQPLVRAALKKAKNGGVPC